MESKVNMIDIMQNEGIELKKRGKAYMGCCPFHEDRKVLLQFFGYSLIPTTKFEKAMMLIGDGANGKSTLIKVGTNLFGKENISTLSLFDLEHRFRLAEIVGKLVNISPDLPNKKVMESSIFKALVSGDSITVEQKYSKPFTFKPFAKLLFATNKLPATQDTSPAFYRRWLITEFPNTFNGKKRDPGLSGKLSTQEELEGLLQLSIEGLNTLYDTEEFAESAGMRKLVADYEKANNSVSYFIDERCQVAPDAEINKAELFAAYNTFTYEEKIPAMGRNDFTKELRSQLPSILELRGTLRKWRGIALIP